MPVTCYKQNNRVNSFKAAGSLVAMTHDGNWFEYFFHSCGDDTL